MPYSQATFRMLVDGVVQVEVSITGCRHDRESVTPAQVTDAAKTLDRIGRAVKKIQRQIDHERGAPASTDAAKVA